MSFGNEKNRLDPEEKLRSGVEILGNVLVTRGFTFHFRDAGKGSGGHFAWGEFVRGDRRLELHFRLALGLVRYHSGASNAAHESYMRELGVWNQCRYPGFSDDPMDGFRGLAHDLQFAEDFLTGSAEVLKAAFEKEAAITKSRVSKDFAGYSGDDRKRDELRSCFREKRYGEVVRLAESLNYPKLLTESEVKMIEIARTRVTG